MNKNRIIEKLSSFASWLGVVVTIITVALYAVSQKDMAVKLEQTNVMTKDIASDYLTDMCKLSNEISKIKIKIDKLPLDTDERLKDIKEQQQKLLLLASTQDMNPKSKQELVELVEKMVIEKLSDGRNGKELQTRIEAIESVVVENPGKAIKIPLIERDVSSLKSSVLSINEDLKSVEDSLKEINVYKSQVESLTNQVNQTNNWMIGILGSLVVSVLGLLIGNVYHQRKV